jgi:hypothetical protein
MPDTPSMEQTLGTISLCCDSTPKHDSDKLDYDGITASDVMGQSSSGWDAPLNAMSLDDASGSADASGAQAMMSGEPDLLALFGKGAGRAGAPGGPVKPGSEEAFYLLATYCFDIQRKLECMYKATRAFARKGDPALARQLLADERRINAPGLTWKQRALRAEARMLELQREIGKEHLRVLIEVAGSDRPRPREQDREQPPSAS